MQMIVSDNTPGVVNLQVILQFMNEVVRRQSCSPRQHPKMFRSVIMENKLPRLNALYFVPCTALIKVNTCVNFNPLSVKSVGCIVSKFLIKRAQNPWSNVINWHPHFIHQTWVISLHIIPDQIVKLSAELYACRTSTHYCKMQQTPLLATAGIRLGSQLKAYFKKQSLFTVHNALTNTPGMIHFLEKKCILFNTRDSKCIGHCAYRNYQAIIVNFEFLFLYCVWNHACAFYAFLGKIYMLLLELYQCSRILPHSTRHRSRSCALTLRHSGIPGCLPLCLLTAAWRL